MRLSSTAIRGQAPQMRPRFGEAFRLRFLEQDGKEVCLHSDDRRDVDRFFEAQRILRDEFYRRGVDVDFFTHGAQSPEQGGNPQSFLVYDGVQPTLTRLKEIKEESDPGRDARHARLELMDADTLLDVMQKQKAMVTKEGLFALPDGDVAAYLEDFTKPTSRIGIENLEALVGQVLKYLYRPLM